MALRDYKKGKYLLENRPGQLLPIGNAKDPMSLKAAEHQQRHVLYKVWNMVEKSMGELRKMLMSQLQDSNRSVEEQEKTLECVSMALALLSPLTPGIRYISGCFQNCNRAMIPSGCISTVITNIFLIKSPMSINLP